MLNSAWAQRPDGQGIGYRDSKRHGMGVGLSISRTIVAAHGGRIWIEPNRGDGTIFRLTRRARSEDLVDAI